MGLVLLSGSSHPSLAAAVAHELELPLGRCVCQRFPDGEAHVSVAALDGAHAVIVQPTSTPVADHLIELLLIADASRRAGAARVSAVVPYFGYARQDKREHLGDALGVHVVGELLSSARLHRIITVDVHSDAAEAALPAPLETLTAVPLIAEVLKKNVSPRSIVVAPDVGASKLGREYARLLGLPLAVVHKVRRSGTDVFVERVAGDVRGLHPIFVDDMVTTGATIVAAARAVGIEGGVRGLTVAATHAVLIPGAMGRLRHAGLERLVVSDTIAGAPSEPAVTVVSVAPAVASAVRRLA
jgi:ribose-phosphate pyrophosphokinase